MCSLRNHFFRVPSKYAFPLEESSLEEVKLKVDLFVLWKSVGIEDAIDPPDVQPNQQKRKYIDTRSSTKATDTQERSNLFSEMRKPSFCLSLQLFNL